MENNRVFTHDSVLILIASFCYMSTVMMINPLIVGFATSIGASALVAGLLAAMMNLTSLIVRPFAGRISDQVSKYRLASIGSMQLELIATF